MKQEAIVRWLTVVFSYILVPFRLHSQVEVCERNSDLINRMTHRMLIVGECQFCFQNCR